MKFTLLTGIPGSGKSTWAKNNANGAVIVSSDDIRLEMFGKYVTNREENSAVFSTMSKRTREALAAGKDVIYDATSISPWARKNALQAVPAGVEKVCVWMDVSAETACERDAGRDRHVPTDVIQRMRTQFKAPSKEEGFDRIIRVAGV